MTAAPRLAIVTGSLSRSAGGLFNSVRMSALALAERGVELIVIGQESARDDEALVAWRPIEPVVGPQRFPAAIGRNPAVGATLVESQFDIVHQHGIWEATAHSIDDWRRRSGGKTMLSPRGMLDPWALQNAGWKKKLVGRLWADRNLHGATCLHALNESEATSMRAYGLRNPIAIIPNGTDLPASEAEGNARIGDNGDGRRTLLFLGRIHPKKGLAELIAAWSLLKEYRPEIEQGWRLVLAGWDDGDHLAGYRAQAEAVGLDIAFPGPAFGAEKAELLRGADAFVMPSFSEGLPMSVLEAWSYGLPVLMSEACNLPVGFAKDAALPAEPGAPTQLAEQIAAALGRDDLSGFGERGRALVEAQFAWRAIAAQHEAVYRWMVEGGTPPPMVHRD